jgi:hypothetical protein
VGSESVYSRTTNAILKAYLEANGTTGNAIREELTPFGHKDWAEIVASIKRFGASGDAGVITTVSGDANIYLYRELVAQGVTANTTPVLETNVVREHLSSMRLKAPSGYEVAMDPSNHHLHKPAIFGEMTAEGRILPVWKSSGLIPPEPWSPWFAKAGNVDALKDDRRRGDRARNARLAVAS